MASSSQHTKSNVTVRCGNISPKTSIAELVSLFTKDPVSIEDIKMRKNEHTQTSSAFVTFLTMEDAKKIVEKYNYTTLNDREIVLTILSSLPNLPENANLFVKNIPKDFTTKTFYDIFKEFGSVASCKISFDANGESKGYGFVQYEDVESVEKAIEGLKNIKFDGKNLLITNFDKSFKEHKKTNDLIFTNVFIKNFPSCLTENELRELLENYGPVHSIYFPVDDDSKPVGFACANFQNSEDALKALEELHDKRIFTTDNYPAESIPSAPFYIQKAEKKKDRIETIRKQLETLSLNGAQSKNNLYVSHIPEAFTEDEIKDHFSKFGTITSIKLQKSTPDSSKQFGYVCFKTAEEAAAAFEAMDGNLLDNSSKLRVSFYKAKNERKNESSSGKSKTSGNDSKDGLSSSGTSKLIQSLVNIVEKTASLYKKDWNVVGATNPTEFSQKMAREFFSVSEKELKEMIGSSLALENKIVVILKNKKEKLSQKNNL